RARALGVQEVLGHVHDAAAHDHADANLVEAAVEDVLSMVLAVHEGVVERGHVPTHADVLAEQAGVESLEVALGHEAAVPDRSLLRHLDAVGYGHAGDIGPPLAGRHAGTGAGTGGADDDSA